MTNSASNRPQAFGDDTKDTGSGIGGFFSSLFGSDDDEETGVLAGMIGLLVFLLVVLDHPYWGEISVSAEPYQLVLSTLMNH